MAEKHVTEAKEIIIYWSHHVSVMIMLQFSHCPMASSSSCLLPLCPGWVVPVVKTPTMTSAYPLILTHKHSTLSSPSLSSRQLKHSLAYRATGPTTFSSLPIPSEQFITIHCRTLVVLNDHIRTKRQTKYSVSSWVKLALVLMGDLT